MMHWKGLPTSEWRDFMKPAMRRIIGDIIFTGKLWVGQKIGLKAAESSFGHATIDCRMLRYVCMKEKRKNKSGRLK